MMEPAFQSIVTLGPITAMVKDDKRLVFDVTSRQFVELIELNEDDPEMTMHDKFVQRFLIGVVVGISLLVVMVVYTTCQKPDNRMELV